MAERLKPAIPDLEARDSTPASRIVSLHKKLYSTLSLLTQVYKFGTADILLGGGRGGWGTRIPSRGSSNTLRHASC